MEPATVSKDEAREERPPVHLRPGWSCKSPGSRYQSPAEISLGAEA